MGASTCKDNSYQVHNVNNGRGTLSSKKGQGKKRITIENGCSCFCSWMLYPIDHKEKKVLGGAALDETKKIWKKHNFDGSYTEANTKGSLCILVK